MGNKKLYRSSKDRILGGVCGGIGEYLEVDPIVIRLVSVALVISGGFGILIYLIAWVLIPNEPGVGRDGAEEIKDKAEEVASSVKRAVKKDQGYSLGVIIGIVLIVFGIGILIQNLIGYDLWRYFWPLMLVLIGLYLVIKASENK